MCVKIVHIQQFIKRLRKYDLQERCKKEEAGQINGPASVLSDSETIRSPCSGCTDLEQLPSRS